MFLKFRGRAGVFSACSLPPPVNTLLACTYCSVLRKGLEIVVYTLYYTRRLHNATEGRYVSGKPIRRFGTCVRKPPRNSILINRVRILRTPKYTNKHARFFSRLPGLVYTISGFGGGGEGRRVSNRNTPTENWSDISYNGEEKKLSVIAPQ